MSAKKHRFHGIGQLESHARAERMRPGVSDRQRAHAQDAQSRANYLAYLFAELDLAKVRWHEIAAIVKRVAGARPC